MPEVFDVSAGVSEEALSATDRALGRGGIVVLPTDTVYGVTARPNVEGAPARLFAAKRRSRDLTLPVLVANLGDAERVAELTPPARRLADRYWPGAVTLVLPRTAEARSWDLGSETETVGVRIPAHEVALEVLRRAGPLAVTSANLSGEPTPRDCDGIVEMLGDEVDVYLCAGPSPIGVASTVVDVTTGEPRVLREGTVTTGDILAAVGEG